MVSTPVTFRGIALDAAALYRPRSEEPSTAREKDLRVTTMDRHYITRQLIYQRQCRRNSETFPAEHMDFDSLCTALEL